MAEPSPKPTPAGKQPAQQPSPTRKRLSFSLHSTIILFLLSFRLLNALTVRTFFQPDEYFQSLEPAWNIVFGDGWITWVPLFPHSSPFVQQTKAITRNGDTGSGRSYTPPSLRSSTQPSPKSRLS